MNNRWKSSKGLQGISCDVVLVCLMPELEISEWILKIKMGGEGGNRTVVQYFVLLCETEIV